MVVAAAEAAGAASLPALGAAAFTPAAAAAVGRGSAEQNHRERLRQLRKEVAQLQELQQQVGWVALAAGGGTRARVRGLRSVAGSALPSRTCARWCPPRGLQELTLLQLQMRKKTQASAGATGVVPACCCSLLTATHAEEQGAWRWATACGGPSEPPLTAFLQPPPAAWLCAGVPGCVAGGASRPGPRAARAGGGAGPAEPGARKGGPSFHVSSFIGLQAGGLEQHARIRR